VKLYNATTATVGTTTPVMTVTLEGSQSLDLTFAHGITFGTGICIGASTSFADNDTGAPSTNDIIAHVLYV
jgi:hypothetical protein